MTVHIEKQRDGVVISSDSGEWELVPPLSLVIDSDYATMVSGEYDDWPAFWIRGVVSAHARIWISGHDRAPLWTGLPRKDTPYDPLVRRGYLFRVTLQSEQNLHLPTAQWVYPPFRICWGDE